MNNIKFKRTLALLLVSVLSVSVVGCRKTPKSDDNGNSSVPVDYEYVYEYEDDSGNELTSNNQSANSPNQSTPNNAGKTIDQIDYLKNSGTKQEKLFGNLEGTTLRIVTGATISDWDKAFMEQFKKKYKLKNIVTVPYSYQEEQAKIVSIIASGDKKNYLDVITTGTTTLLRYVYGNILQPIDKYIDKSDSAWSYNGTSMFAPDFFKVNGKIYGSPLVSFDEQYVFYNKTYFKENNIPDPYTEYYLKNNWNFETFKDVAKKATTYAADGKTVKTYGFSMWNYFSFLNAAGNTVIKQNKNGKWNPCFDDEAGMAALKLLYDCKYNNWLSPYSGYTEFIERKTAMFLEKPVNAMGGTDAYNKMSDAIGMVPMPKWRNSDPYYAPVIAEGRGVPVCAKNVGAAVAYIYEYNVAAAVRNASEAYRTQRRKWISDEHLKIRNEYLKQCKFSYTLVDGLTGFYTENRGKFFDIMFNEKIAPANAVDRMKPLIQESIKKTVG